MISNPNASLPYDFSVFDYINNAVFMVDESYKFIYGNSAFEVLIGMTREEIQKHIVHINTLLKFSLNRGILNLEIFTPILKRKIIEKKDLGLLEEVGGVTFQKYILRDKKYVTGFIVITEQVIIAKDVSAAQAVELKKQGSKRARDRLTRCELQVLRLLADGFMTKEIAYLLGNSVYTIANHQKSIYKKLSVNSKITAIIKGRKQGFLTI